MLVLIYFLSAYSGTIFFNIAHKPTQTSSKGPGYRNSKCADMHVVCLYITKALHTQFGTFLSNSEKQRDKNLSLTQANSLLNLTAPAKKGFLKIA